MRQDTNHIKAPRPKTPGTSDMKKAMRYSTRYAACIHRTDQAPCHKPDLSRKIAISPSAKCIFFKRSHAFLRRPWVFSRALGFGERRGAACAPRRKFGSRAGSVTRAQGVQRLKMWQVVAGLLSAEIEPSKAMENPYVSCFAPPL